MSKTHKIPQSRQKSMGHLHLVCVETSVNQIWFFTVDNEVKIHQLAVLWHFPSCTSEIG